MNLCNAGGPRAPVAGRGRQRWVTIYNALWMGFPQGVGKLGLLTLGALSRTEKQCFHSSLGSLLCAKTPGGGGTEGNKALAAQSDSPRSFFCNQAWVKQWFSISGVLFKMHRPQPHPWRVCSSRLRMEFGRLHLQNLAQQF